MRCEPWPGSHSMTLYKNIIPLTVVFLRQVIPLKKKGEYNAFLPDINYRLVYNILDLWWIPPAVFQIPSQQEIAFYISPHTLQEMPYDPMQVYQPEVDTYLLLEAARKEVKSGDRVLEVGTGSGIISRELTKLAGIVATDINPHAVLCASRAGIEVVRTDLVCGLRGAFDLILFNPPYLPTQPEERMDDWLEYALDGGKNGRAVIERFALTVDDVLAPEGRILLLISSLTGLPDVQGLFAGQGYSAGIAMQQDVEGEVLYVLKIIRKDRSTQGSGIIGASGGQQR
jgi:release factor glutamine methyltransferase